jgi:hypothetical protein
MAQKPKRGTGMPLPPTPPEGGPDDQDYVYMSPGEQQAVQPYYGLPLMTPEMRRYRVGGRQMMDPRNFEFARQMREKAAQGTRLKKGGPVKKYEEGGMVEIEIKVGAGGKGKHKMPDGSMMDDSEMEDAEEYKKGGKVKKMAKGGATGGKWIQSAIKKPGALRAQMGVKAGAKIPAKKLASAAKKPGKLGQRARLAQTLSKMKGK